MPMEECSSSVAADFIEEAGSRRLRQSGWILPSVYFRCTESTTKASSCGEDSNETKWRHFFFANLPACVVGLEACGGAHHWARRLQPPVVGKFEGNIGIFEGPD